MYEEEEEDTRSLIHGSRELQFQIVLSAIVVLVFALVVVVLPLLFTPPDPIIALIFSLLLAAGGAFLGGSLIYGYFKMKVGAEARKCAQEMLEEAIHGGAARKSMEEVFVEEKERLIDKLEKEKEEYFNGLQAEFNKRLDEEENALMEDVRREFEKQMEKEKEAYLSKVDEDLRSQLTKEQVQYQDSMRGEFSKRMDDEKKAYQEAIRAEFEKRLGEEKADYERRQMEFDSQLKKEKDNFNAQAARMEEKYQKEKKDVEEKLKSDFELRLDAEKNAYTDIVRKDFESWKKEFTDAFRKEIMRDVPPPKPPEATAPPWVEKERPPAPKQKEDLSDIFTPASKEAPVAREEPKAQRSYDFKSMDSGGQVDAAVDYIGGLGGQGTLTFRNTKTRRQVTLKGRGKDMILESAVEEISIKSRLMLREFAAQNRLPMDKNDDYVRVNLGQEAGSVKRNLREALETAFATQIENLTFEVKTG
jgi:hypothetical protein